MLILCWTHFFQKEYRPSSFSFSHKSFQEYFAALALTSESVTKAATIISQSNSDTLIEFFANLIDREENIIFELIKQGHIETAFKIVSFLPSEKRDGRLFLVKTIGENLGLSARDFQWRGEPKHKVNELLPLWQNCKNETDPQQKGKNLEDFVETLFSQIFDIVSKDRLTDFGEIDLICELKEVNAFWGRWPSDFFVECKNQRDKSPVGDINEFIGKASICCARLGVFVSLTGFTNDAINSMKRSWGKTGMPEIFWIDGSDLEEWLQSTEQTEAFLKRMCRRANWGR